MLTKSWLTSGLIQDIGNRDLESTALGNVNGEQSGNKDIQCSGTSCTRILSRASTGLEAIHFCTFVGVGGGYLRE